MTILERKYLPVLFLIILLSGQKSISQTPFDYEFDDIASGITEQLQVFTDRSVYIIDEEILFRADHIVTGLKEDTPWSSMLYVELVDAAGVAVNQGKYRIQKGATTGSMHIPVEILSGNYHLKSYTRWMRNSGSDNFSYYPLKIINPFQSEVVSHPEGEASRQQPPQVIFRQEELSCTTDFSQYNGGEKIQIKIEIPPDSSLERLHGCVTVVPAGTIEVSEGQYLSQSLTPEPAQFKVGFLPDIGSGVSLSGVVVDPYRTPVPYANLHFSMLGETPGFYVVTTDVHGRFILSV